MAKGHKNYQLRGGVDADDFPPKDISLKDLRDVGKIAWEKWGYHVADWPIRDLIALAYAEGLYHGSQIIRRNPELLSNTIGSTPSGASLPAAPASSSAMIATETPSVRDLLESL